jgi:hypothetical protein
MFIAYSDQQGVIHKEFANEGKIIKQWIPGTDGESVIEADVRMRPVLTELQLVPIACTSQKIVVQWSATHLFIWPYKIQLFLFPYVKNSL